MTDNLEHINVVTNKLGSAAAVLNALIDQFTDLENGPSLLQKDLGELIGLAETLVQEAVAALRNVKP